MAINVQAYRDGGFVFGMGNAAVPPAAAAIVPNPVLSPGTPVRFTRLVCDSVGATIPSEDTIQNFTLDDQDILLTINPANPNFPAEACYPDSVINPDLGFIAQRDSQVTVGRLNTNLAAAPFQAQWQARCSVASPNPNTGIEGSTLQGQQDIGRGRFLGLGQSTDAGVVRTGTPLSARDLLLYHLCISADTNQLTVTQISIDDFDWITGGASGVTQFDRQNPQFGWGGARVTKSSTITVTTAGGAGGAHCEGITCQVA